MKKILQFALASGLLAIAPAYAFNPQPDPPGFGLIGINIDETLRFNVSNISGATRAFPPDPYRVEIAFVDATGAELLPAVQTTLAPGQSTSVDLNGADVLGHVTSTDSFSLPLRTEVRPVIRIIPIDTIRRLPPGPCISTIELIDNRTGKTLLTSGPQNPGTIYEFNPQPDPPGKTFGLVGIVAGQTIRLAAVNIVAPDRFTPPDPCRVTFTLLDVNGVAVASSSEILKPGQGSFLDLPFPTTVTTADTNAVDAVPSQLQLRGVVTVQSLNQDEPPDPCITSLEVFDQATGRTSTLLWPQKVSRFGDSRESE
jgi:hypothetical protein